MKTPEFFTEKANQYIAEIERITTNYIPFSLTHEKSGFQEQSDEISDLKLKIKLLFSEFEHGYLFVEKVISTKNNTPYNSVNQDQLLIVFRRYLTLFVEHLRLFRGE